MISIAMVAARIVTEAGRVTAAVVYLPPARQRFVELDPPLAEPLVGALEVAARDGQAFDLADVNTMTEAALALLEPEA